MTRRIPPDWFVNAYDAALKTDHRDGTGPSKLWDALRKNRWAAFTTTEIDSILHGLNADLPSSDGLTRAALIGETHRELTRRKDADGS